jgi:hypothetical protein
VSRIRGARRSTQLLRLDLWKSLVLLSDGDGVNRTSLLAVIAVTLVVPGSHLLLAQNGLPPSCNGTFPQLNTCVHFTDYDCGRDFDETDCATICAPFDHDDNPATPDVNPIRPAAEGGTGYYFEAELVNTCEPIGNERLHYCGIVHRQDPLPPHDLKEVSVICAFQNPCYWDIMTGMCVESGVNCVPHYTPFRNLKPCRDGLQLAALRDGQPNHVRLPRLASGRSF